MNAQARLGAFVLIAIITLALFSSKIGNFHWIAQEGRAIDVVFSDASGISVQTLVLMAGVPVGTVKAIKLKDNQALLTLNIQPGISLPASTRAYIAGGGLVGEKYIALQATPGDITPLKKTVIPSNSDGNFRDMISRASGLTEDASRFFNKAEQVVNTVDQLVKDNRQDVRTTMQALAASIEENRPDIRSTTQGLAAMVDKNRKQVDRLMRTLPQAAESSRTFFTEGTATMRSLRAMIVDNRENLYRTLFELRIASENLAAFSDDIRLNPWKILKEKPNVKPDRRVRQRQMEEMLMTTGSMGLEPARN